MISDTRRPERIRSRPRRRRAPVSGPIPAHDPRPRIVLLLLPVFPSVQGCYESSDMSFGPDPRDANHETSTPDPLPDVSDVRAPRHLELYATGRWTTTVVATDDCIYVGDSSGLRIFPQD